MTISAAMSTNTLYPGIDVGGRPRGFGAVPEFIPEFQTLRNRMTARNRGRTECHSGVFRQRGRGSPQISSRVPPLIWIE